MRKTSFKFIITFALLFTLAFAFGGKPIESAPYSEVTIASTEGLQVSPGVSFDTVVTIHNAERVSGFQFQFMYDAAKFEVESVKKSTNLFSNIVANIAVPGQITLNYSDIDTENLLNGSVDLFTITFKPNDELSIGTHQLLWMSASYLQQITWVDIDNEIYTVSQINYQLPTVRTGIYGDVNGDGVVSIMDVSFIQQYLAGIRTLTPTQLILADVNGDGIVSIIDVGQIQQFLAGIRASIGPTPSDDKVLVTFMVDGGTAIAPIYVNKGSALSQPDDPEKEGFIFIGWFTDFARTIPFNFASVLNQDTTLYAKWEKDDEELLKISEVLNIIHSNTEDVLVNFVGRVIGKDSNGYIFVADETGVIYVRQQFPWLVGYNIKIRGHAGAYYGTSAYPEYYPQIQSYDFEAEEYHGYVEIGPHIYMDLNEFIVTPGMDIKSAHFFNQIVTVSGYVEVGETHFDIFLTDEDGNRLLNISHFSTNVNRTLDPNLNEFASLDGEFVTVTGVINRFNTAQEMWTIICIGLYRELIIYREDNNQTLRVAIDSIQREFALNLGGNTVSTQNIRDLIHGYSTVVETRNGEFVFDTTTVLAQMPVVSLDENNNKTYTFTLNQDLVWNNGVPITAKDYVFSVLLQSSPEWRDFNGSRSVGGAFVGFNQFINNETGTSLDVPFAGVRLLGDYAFSLTIDANQLPYFYERMMVKVDPLPLMVYLPGFNVVDTPDGAKMIQNGSNDTVSNVLYDIVIREDGYRHFPIISSGPYYFVSWTPGFVRLEKNPLYKGNYEGNVPTIQSIEIVQGWVDYNTLYYGETDILLNIIDSYTINNANRHPNFETQSYIRNGYGFISMKADFGPTQYLEVRQAIGFMIDREVFIERYLGSMGAIVDGPYGLAQWFYLQTKDELETKLIHYQHDIAQANALLDQSPYKYEQDGVTLFDPAKVVAGSGYYRYNAQGERLALNHLGTYDNLVTDLIDEQITMYAWQLGIDYTLTYCDFNELLNHYYYSSTIPLEDRIYHTFNLATNFSSAYDPYTTWHSDYLGTWVNPSGLSDQILDDLILQLTALDPSQTEEFKAIFVQYIERWNYLLPQLPLYSNEYVNIYASYVEGLNTSPVWRWSQDIANIRLVNKPFDTNLIYMRNMIIAYMLEDIDYLKGEYNLDEAKLEALNEIFEVYVAKVFTAKLNDEFWQFYYEAYDEMINIATSMNLDDLKADRILAMTSAVDYRKPYATVDSQLEMQSIFDDYAVIMNQATNESEIYDNFDKFMYAVMLAFVERDDIELYIYKQNLTGGYLQNYFENAEMLQYYRGLILAAETKEAADLLYAEAIDYARANPHQNLIYLDTYKTMFSNWLSESFYNMFYRFDDGMAPFTIDDLEAALLLIANATNIIEVMDPYFALRRPVQSIIEAEEINYFREWAEELYVYYQEIVSSEDRPLLDAKYFATMNILNETEYLRRAEFAMESFYPFLNTLRLGNDDQRAIVLANIESIYRNLVFMASPNSKGELEAILAEYSGYINNGEYDQLNSLEYQAVKALYLAFEADEDVELILLKDRLHAALRAIANNSENEDLKAIYELAKLELEAAVNEDAAYTAFTDATGDMLMVDLVGLIDVSFIRNLYVIWLNADYIIVKDLYGQDFIDQNDVRIQSVIDDIATIDDYVILNIEYFQLRFELLDLLWIKQTYAAIDEMALAIDPDNPNPAIQEVFDDFTFKMMNTAYRRLSYVYEMQFYYTVYN